MKIKADKILTVLVIGLVFPSIINTNFNLSNYRENYIQIDANPIFINGTATGVGAHNWTWAVGQSWCSGNGIYSDPYIIENLKIKGTGFETGIEIWNSNVSFIIQDCLIYNTDLAIWIENVNNSRLIDNNCSNNNAGIYIEYSNNNTISGNTANDNNQQGIYLYDSDHNYITENTANNNDNGVEMDTSCENNYIGGNTANNNTWIGIASFAMCHFNNITGNTANNNGNIGIYLEDECNNNVISGNTVNDNADTGIHLSGNCDYNIITESIVNNNTYNGIYIYGYCDSNTISNNLISGTGSAAYGISVHWYSDKNTFIENTILHNVEIGIELYDFCEDNTVSDNIVSYNGLNGIGIYDFSDYNTITDNLLYNNAIGLYIDNSDNNTIYENVFSKNGEHAFEDGIDNTWNSTFFGNYWDNHTGPDTSPQDGIVDDPYTHIGGPTGSIDYLPIAEDGSPSITINSPDPSEVFYSIAPSFNVIITDDYLDEMWYTIDGGLNNYTFTDNGTIDQSAWDAKSVGSITITFYANDTLGHEASEDVIITKSIPSDGDDPTIVIVIVVVSIVGGVAVIAAAYLFLKKRKA